jgi:small-conductance mechanosensitive channel
MRRPAILWFVVVFGSLATFGNLLEAVGALSVVSRRPFSEVLGHVVISLGIVAASMWVIVALLKKSLRSKLPVSLYLWGMLVIYPLYNVFRAVGLYLPRAEILPEQLAGAAAFEIVRYVVILALIVWVAVSKSLRSHLASEPAHVG